MNPIRVANVVAEPRVGGPQLRIAAVAAALRDHGVDTTVLLPDEESDGGGFKRLLEGQRVAYRTIQLHRMTLRRGPTHVLAFASRALPEIAVLARLLRRERFDIVHGNSISQLQAPVAGHLAKCRVVWQMNDCQTPLAISRPLAALAWHIADAIPVSAEAAGRYHFPAHFRPGHPRFPVLRAPVGLDRFHPHGPRAEVPHDRDLVLTVGNISRVKGIDLLLQAAAKVVARRPRALFWVVGERLATQARFLARVDRLVAENDLAENVQFLGRRDDVPELLRAARLYVCPSRSEACPMSVLEAMACGTPVVAHAVGGIPELIRQGKDGLLVKLEDPTRMAEAICSLLERMDLARILAESAQKRVAAEFSIAHATQAHVQMYRSVLNSHNQ